MTKHSMNITFMLMLLVISICLSEVAVFAPFSDTIQSYGSISYGSVAKLRGVVRYGLDVNPAWYEMTLDDFNFMTSTLPAMNFMVLPCEVPTLMPNAINGDYNTTKSDILEIILNYFSWCKQKNIRILISNFWQPSDMWTNPEREQAVTAYWKFLASKFKGNDTIAGFDLINEPWDIPGANEELVPLYERIIDSIRRIDPDRTCYVQSYVPHNVGLGWVRSNPVKRDNIVYVHHLYSNDWVTGDWYASDYTHPWSKYYLSHDYIKAKEVLINGESAGLGLYQRFGFVEKELGLPVAVTEVAFLDTPEGLQYGRDVLSILNDWSIDWAYDHWMSPSDRPMILLKNDGVTLRNQTIVVRENL